MLVLVSVVQVVVVVLVVVPQGAGVTAEETSVLLVCVAVASVAETTRVAVKAIVVGMM